MDWFKFSPSFRHLTSTSSTPPRDISLLSLGKLSSSHASNLLAKNLKVTSSSLGEVSPCIVSIQNPSALLTRLAAIHVRYLRQLHQLDGSATIVQTLPCMLCYHRRPGYDPQELLREHPTYQISVGFNYQPDGVIDATVPRSFDASSQWRIPLTKG
jgi:hypothetical protein